MGLESLPNTLAKETNNFPVLWRVNRIKHVRFLIVSLALTQAACSAGVGACKHERGDGTPHQCLLEVPGPCAPSSVPVTRVTLQCVVTCHSVAAGLCLE